MPATKCRRKVASYEAMKVSASNLDEIREWCNAEGYTIESPRVIFRINWVNYILDFGDVLVHDLVFGKWMVLSYSDFYGSFDYAPFDQ